MGRDRHGGGQLDTLSGPPDKTQLWSLSQSNISARELLRRRDFCIPTSDSTTVVSSRTVDIALDHVLARDFARGEICAQRCSSRGLLACRRYGLYGLIAGMAVVFPVVASLGLIRTLSRNAVSPTSR